MRKAQGSLEYLVIIAVVLLVSGVVVYLVTGSAGSSKKSILVSNCQAAAEQCHLLKAANPDFVCSSCDSQCVDSASGEEIFNGAVDCCKAGNSSGIYDGSTGCSGSGSIQICSQPIDCDDSNVCTADSCSGGSCVYSNVADGVLCDSGTGECSSGSCIHCIDDDSDGYGVNGGSDCTYSGVEYKDCNDSNPNVNPGVSEDCSNNIDDDCDGLVDLDDSDCLSITTLDSYYNSSLNPKMVVGDSYAIYPLNWDNDNGANGPFFLWSTDTNLLYEGSCAISSSYQFYQIFYDSDDSFVLYADSGFKGLSIAFMPNYCDISDWYDWYNLDNGHALTVFASNGYAYLGGYSDNSNLVILNLSLSNPDFPDFVGSIKLRNIWDIYVDGSYAYAVGDRFYIIDVTDKKNPSKLSEFNFDGSSTGVYVDGSYAYVTNGSGLLIFDVSDKSSPALVTSYPIVGGARDVVVKNNYAFVSSESEGVIVLNVFDPSNPKYMSTWLSSSSSVFINWPNIYSVTLFNHHVYYGKIS